MSRLVARIARLQRVALPSARPRLGYGIANSHEPECNRRVPSNEVFLGFPPCVYDQLHALSRRERGRLCGARMCHKQVGGVTQLMRLDFSEEADCFWRPLAVWEQV